MPLKNVGTIDCGQSGPLDLAVRLAKGAQQKRNPIVDVLIVTRNSSGRAGAAWSNSMTTPELLELFYFVGMVIDDHYREEFSDELDRGEFDEEGE